MHLAMLKISENRTWESSTSSFAVPAIFHCKLVPFSVGTNSVTFFSISMVSNIISYHVAPPKESKSWSISMLNDQYPLESSSKIHGYD